ncbi:hypothetical protein J2Y41_003832 [Arthrobacter sp. 1088]|uniref:hypothetical protein n=1 Tax=Arthrobacter sp. 1088 TaxID=2817768 RepID=UPI00285B3112|nr:hypothetical protein [Arthrobacter sp. 1088]MDR6688246.1 hypothetical protein [Arthrobacter sp. 1088]
MVFDRVPSDLESVLTSWIEWAIAAGAEFAWFGFEGSFDFNHILTEDVGNQICGVGTSEIVALALEDDFRQGPDWGAELSDLREQLKL